MKKSILACFVLGAIGLGCKGVGFKDLADPKHIASVQTAREVIKQVQAGLRAYHDLRGSYPLTNDIHLYDSIQTFVNIDPAQLYRNDDGKGYYIAIGGRANRLIYRYPATVGPGEYTLYWSGPNSIDEEGEGDDLPGWESAYTNARFERHKSASLKGDGLTQKLSLIRTGADLTKDSVLFSITEDDTLLYSDKWPLQSYVKARPELAEMDQRKVLREELERFFNGSQFMNVDSLEHRKLGSWAEFKPGSPQATAMSKAKVTVFNYYSPTTGPKGIAWDVTKKKFVKVWQGS